MMSWATLGEYVGNACRKDWNDTKNQCYGYNQKAFFELYLILCLIKLYFKIIFWIVLAMKYEKKSLLGWEHLSYVKDWWKTNEL